MLYIIEFLIVVCVIVGAALYGILLVSPLLSVLLALCLAVWLLKIQARGGLAIIGSTYGVLTLATYGISALSG